MPYDNGICCGNCKHEDTRPECHRPQMDSLGADWNTCLGWEPDEGDKE